MGRHVDVLSQQAEAVPARQDFLEFFARTIAFTERRERLDPPEGADQERGLRRTEVVRAVIAHQEIAPSQVGFDGGDSAAQPCIRNGQEVEFCHQQQAGIEGLAAEGGDEAAQCRIPRFAADAFADDPCLVRPVVLALFELRTSRFQALLKKVGLDK